MKLINLILITLTALILPVESHDKNDDTTKTISGTYEIVSETIRLTERYNDTGEDEFWTETKKSVEIRDASITFYHDGTMESDGSIKFENTDNNNGEIEKSFNTQRVSFTGNYKMTDSHLTMETGETLKFSIIKNNSSTLILELNETKRYDEDEVFENYIKLVLKKK